MAAHLRTVFPVATGERPVPNKSECQIQPEYGERGTGKVCYMFTSHWTDVSSISLSPSLTLSLAN